MNRRIGVFFFLVLFSGCAFAVRWPAFAVKSNKSEKVFRGVFHVHSFYSHDSKADFSDLIETARKANLDFVVVTDHNNTLAKEAYDRSSLPRDPLLVFGNEVSSSEGHIIMLGVYEEPPPDRESGQEVIDWAHEKGGYAIIPHPFSPKSDWDNWNVQNFDGIEIYNFFHSIYDSSLIEFGLEFAFLPPHYFLKALDRPMAKTLPLWDERLEKGRLAGLGGTDAHTHFKFGNFSPENLLLSYQAVNVFALADSLEPEKIVEALGKGRSFTAFETEGDAGQFSFTAEAGGNKYRMGDTIPVGSEITFRIQTPLPARILLIHHGNVILEHEGVEAVFKTGEAGAYRVEVQKNSKPWIMANPIYAEG